MWAVHREACGQCAVGADAPGSSAARRGKWRAEAAAWVQAELDYLRVQGYSFLADDVAAGTRTLTQSSGYTTYGDLAEPGLPAGAGGGVGGRGWGGGRGRSVARGGRGRGAKQRGGARPARGQGDGAPGAGVDV